ncbi:GTP-binding protein [Cytobacillus depressus]|uniref:GTP-binding protein n=1 Tax=Cytobacillus depressus TaxID=1602942 RepID=A0A6L3V5T7_9BACI|nr:CobW family GTP-binding protein [Cytobacillus depressus]KAB2336599.1 GTP-binding protein [Cytobacillus depressus]
MSMIPVYILSGFLGSGKTTLLSRMLQYFKQKDKKAAVIMNEIGDVNMDGLLLENDVPVVEMLNGCICCTIRKDLCLTLSNIYHEVQPDLIIIEATGVANPLELIEGIASASLDVNIELRLVTTVVAAPHFLLVTHRARGKTRRLMEEQIRCADLLLLNQTDQLVGDYIEEVKDKLVTLNQHAKMIETVRCEIDMDLMFQPVPGDLEPFDDMEKQQESLIENMNQHVHHHTHQHVMTYTHRFDGGVDRQGFEELFRRIPNEVYRAKGIVKFTGDDKFYLFQYAFREMEMVKINPQHPVVPVAVFIGEHFDRIQVQESIQNLTGTLLQNNIKQSGAILEEELCFFQ